MSLNCEYLFHTVHSNMESIKNFQHKLELTDDFLDYHKQYLAAAEKKLKEQEQQANRRTDQEICIQNLQILEDDKTNLNIGLEDQMIKELTKQELASDYQKYSSEMQLVEKKKQEQDSLFHNLRDQKKKEEYMYRDETQKLPLCDKNSLTSKLKKTKIEAFNPYSELPFSTEHASNSNIDDHPKEFQQFLSSLSAEFSKEDLKTACSLAAEDLSYQINDPRYKLDIECIKEKNFPVALESQLIQIAKQKSVERSKQFHNLSYQHHVIDEPTPNNKLIPSSTAAAQVKLSGGGGEPIRDEFGNILVRRGMNPVLFPYSVHLTDDVQRKEMEHHRHMEYREQLKQQIMEKQFERERRKQEDALAEELHILKVEHERRKIYEQYQKEINDRQRKLEEKNQNRVSSYQCPDVVDQHAVAAIRKPMADKTKNLKNVEKSSIQTVTDDEKDDIWKNIEEIRRIAVEQQRAAEASAMSKSSYIVSSRNILGESTIDTD